MYEDFYGLYDRPFKLTADARYFYPADNHSKILDGLEDEIANNNPILLLTGDIGAGKTLLLRALTKRLGDSASVFQFYYPPEDRKQLMCMMLSETDMQTVPADNKVLIEDIKKRLLHIKQSGKKALLVIDEAQGIGREALDLIRQISWLVDSRSYLASILMCGQADLQRIAAYMQDVRASKGLTYYLKGLSQEETAPYIHYRMSAAGCPDDNVFDENLITEIYRLTGGIPRLINTICESLLVQGALLQQKVITPDLLRELPVNIMHNTAVKSAPERQENDTPGPAGRKDRGVHQDGQVVHVSSGIAIDVSGEYSGIEQPYQDSGLDLRILFCELNAPTRVEIAERLTDGRYKFEFADCMDKVFQVLDRGAPGELIITVLDAGMFYSTVGVEDSKNISSLDILLASYAHVPLIMTSTMPLTSLRSGLYQRGIPFLVQKPDVTSVSASALESSFGSYLKELDHCISIIYVQFSAFYEKNIKKQNKTADMLN